MIHSAQLQSLRNKIRNDCTGIKYKFLYATATPIHKNLQAMQETSYYCHLQNGLQGTGNMFTHEIFKQLVD